MRKIRSHKRGGYGKRLARATKKSVINTVSLGLFPLRLTGNLVRASGSFIDKTGKNRSHKPPDDVMGKKKKRKFTIWTGHVMQVTGKTVKVTADMISFPVIIWQDYSDNEKARLRMQGDLDAKMGKAGWLEVPMDEKDLPAEGYKRAYVAPSANTSVESGVQIMNEVGYQ